MFESVFLLQFCHMSVYGHFRKCENDTPEVSKVHFKKCQNDTVIILIIIRLIIVILIFFQSAEEQKKMRHFYAVYRTVTYPCIEITVFGPYRGTESLKTP